MGHNRNRDRGGGRPTPPKQQVYKDEYNLEDNFKKVRQYAKNSNRPKRDVTEQEDHFDGLSRVINSSQSTMNGPTESDSWNKYTHLDDKITDFQNQNEDAHVQIRKDLGDKINDEVKDLRSVIKSKLSTAWFVRAIAVLAAIASLFFILSYSKVLGTQDKHTEEIQETKLQIKDVGSEVKEVKKDINSINEELKNTSKGGNKRIVK